LSGRKAQNNSRSDQPWTNTDEIGTNNSCHSEHQFSEESNAQQSAEPYLFSVFSMADVLDVYRRPSASIGG
jgi:hypothetical protein